MGSANSTIPAAAVAVVGALGYGYVHYHQPSRAGGTDTDSDTNTNAGTVLHGQKKRGRKLQLPGDATLKNLDFLDSPPTPPLPPATTPPVPARPKQQTAPRSQGNAGDVVPGGFGGGNVSDDAHRSPPLQPPRLSKNTITTRRKKKKAATDPASTSITADASAVPVPAPTGTGKTEKAQVSVPAGATADASDERWTRVEARKKKAAVSPQDGLSRLTDATTSDAGITTSVTGNSSPVTERTTEDELPSGLDDSAQGASSLDAAPRVHPLSGEQPVEGFQWDDYGDVQVDGDASSEDDGGWGVVRSRKRPTKTESGSTVTAPQLQQQSKKQRQNAQKREAQKEAKRERDAQQQAALSSHKRELEGARRVDQAATSSKRTGSRYDSLHLP